jgi:hypothetical protein
VIVLLLVLLFLLLLGVGFASHLVWLGCVVIAIYLVVRLALGTGRKQP